MQTLDKKLSKALKHFERREIKPKEYIERPSKPTKEIEPELVLGNGGKYHLQEFVFLPIGEDGKRRYTTIISQNIIPLHIAEELGWDNGKLTRKIEKARKDRAIKNRELEHELYDFTEAGVLTPGEAEQFMFDREKGNISEIEENYFLEKCDAKLARLEEAVAKQKREQQKEVREAARLEKERAEREAKEQERLEKYRAEWTPRSKTIGKVYEALKASRNQENIAELDYTSIMDKTGIGSRSTVAKALAELKEAEKIKIAPQYHKSNGYYIFD